MKDNSSELSQLIGEVKNLIGIKIKYLSENDILTAEIQKEINNIARKIEALDDYLKEIKGLYSSRNDIVINFRKRTNDIMTEIELL